MFVFLLISVFVHGWFISRDIKLKVEKTKKKIGENLTPEITQMLENVQTSEEVDEIVSYL